MKQALTTLGFLLCLIVSVQSQNCGSVTIEPNSPVSTNFTFDSFSHYEGGITINNVATIRLNIQDDAIPLPACSWFLYVEVNNNPGSGSAPADWETLATYGAGAATTPTIDLLQFKVRNNCQTSPIDGLYQTFATNGDRIDIIADLLPLTAAGSCAQNVNGPGSYLTNYDEYTFTLDVRIIPGYDFDPGIYELDLRFRVEEQ